MREEKLKKYILECEMKWRRHSDHHDGCGCVSWKSREIAYELLESTADIARAREIISDLSSWAKATKDLYGILLEFNSREEISLKLMGLDISHHPKSIQESIEKAQKFLEGECD